MTRSASSSLKGYSYQFHQSIFEILNLSNDGDKVTLEGIEDVDVKNECVQVKYLPSAKLIPSAIQKPVLLMLEDYVLHSSGRQDVNYKLYAYFGDNTGNQDFLNKNDFFKKCAQTLIDDKNKSITSISDKRIEEFISKFSLKIGEEFEEKVKAVKDKIQQVLNVTKQEVDLYFYPNAMNYVFSLSIQLGEDERTVSKKGFLQEINQKKILFGIWQKLEKSRDKLLADIKKQLKSGDFNHNKSRLVFIDNGFLSSDSTGYNDLNLLLNLIEKYTPINQSRTAQPLTIVVQTPEEELKSLKECLINNGIEFNDGHELIHFSSDIFNRKPIINLKAPLYQKIEKVSYEIKIINLKTYIDNIEDIDKPHTAVYFSQDLPFNLTETLQYHIPIIETYREINEILH